MPRPGDSGVRGRCDLGAGERVMIVTSSYTDLNGAKSLSMPSLPR